MAVALLAWAVQNSRWRLTANAGVLAFACLMLVRVNMMVLPQFSVLGFADATFADQHAAEARAEAVKAAVEPQDRIFIVTQGDDGTLWFTYSCYFLPNILDYSGWEADRDTGRWGGGGGTFGLPENQPPQQEGGAVYYHPYTLAEICLLYTSPSPRDA